MLLLFFNRYAVIQQHTGCLEHNTGEPQGCLFQGLKGRPIPWFSLQSLMLQNDPLLLPVLPAAAATECE